MTMALTEQGLKDGLRDLDQIRRILVDRRQDAEARLASAEQDVTELRKLESFAAVQVDAMAARLVALTGEPAKDRPAL